MSGDEPGCVVAAKIAERSRLGDECLGGWHDGGVEPKLLNFSLFFLPKRNSLPEPAICPVLPYRGGRFRGLIDRGNILRAG